MVSETMRALRNRRQQKIADMESENSAQQAAENLPSEGESKEVAAEDDQPDTRGDDGSFQPDDIDTYNDPDADDGGDSDNADDDGDDADLNYRDRFNRLKGKVSGLEKERNAERERAQKLEEELRLARQQSAGESKEVSSDNSPVDDAALEAQLAKEVGEDWEYLDDATRRAMLAMAKREAQKTNPKVEVERALAERDYSAKRERFISRMDTALKPLGVTGFVSLANSSGFADWLDAKRSRVAVFSDAAAYMDEDAVSDLTMLIKAYLDSKAARKKTTKDSPNMQSRTGKSQAKQGEKISFEQYAKAVKDKRFAHKRAMANKIIARWKKQQGE